MRFEKTLELQCCLLDNKGINEPIKKQLWVQVKLYLKNLKPQLQQLNRFLMDVMEISEPNTLAKSQKLLGEALTTIENNEVDPNIEKNYMKIQVFLIPMKMRYCQILNKKV